MYFTLSKIICLSSSWQECIFHLFKILQESATKSCFSSWTKLFPDGNPSWIYLCCCTCLWYSWSVCFKFCNFAFQIFYLFVYLISYLCLATPGGARGHDSLSWTVLFWVIVWSPWTALGRVALLVIDQLIFLFFKVCFFMTLPVAEIIWCH